MAPRIHVVINPGSGKPKPILHTLNAVFRPRDIEWEISLTRKSGERSDLPARQQRMGRRSWLLMAAMEPLWKSPAV